MLQLQFRMLLGSWRPQPRSCLLSPRNKSSLAMHVVVLEGKTPWEVRGACECHTLLFNVEAAMCRWEAAAEAVWTMGLTSCVLTA